MTKFSKLVIGLTSMVCIVGAVYLSLVVLYLSPTNARDYQNPARQAEMMEIILEWGRLAPFPDSATNTSIKTEGSSLSRSFRASFVAPKQDIETWMKVSPGIAEATPEEISDNKFYYIIEPGGGAQWAEVTIDFASNKVEIYVYWS